MLCNSERAASLEDYRERCQPNQTKMNRASRSAALTVRKTAHPVGEPA